MADRNTPFGERKPLPRPSAMPAPKRRPGLKPVRPAPVSAKPALPVAPVAVSAKPTLPAPASYSPQRLKKRPAPKPNPFAGLNALGKRLGQGYGAVRSRLTSRVLGMVAAAFLAVAMLALLMWSVTHHNAFAVYLDGELFGYIAFTGEVNHEQVAEEVQRRMEDREGAQLRLVEVITLRPTNRGDALPFSEAMERLALALTFQVVGQAIEVDGRQVAVLRNLEEAEEVKFRLQSPFLQRDVDYYRIEFVEDVRLATRTVNPEDLHTIEYTLSHLGRRTLVMQDYTVQDGDTLGDIAVRHRISLDRLVQDNPGITLDTIIRPGDVLQIEATRPYLSVLTIEATARTAPIPMEIRQLENEQEFTTFHRVIQEGMEGQQEIVTHLTRVNGVQIGPAREVYQRDVQAMVPRITETGTLEIPVERR